MFPPNSLHIPVWFIVLFFIFFILDAVFFSFGVYCLIRKKYKLSIFTASLIALVLIRMLFYLSDSFPDNFSLFLVSLAFPFIFAGEVVGRMTDRIDLAPGTILVLGFVTLYGAFNLLEMVFRRKKPEK